MKNRNINNHNNWETPKDLYEKLDAEFNFDYDPCPISFIPITAENDGLLKNWGERNFINPPYSRKLKEAFVKKSIEESKKGKLCVCLLPVSTSTVLFHDYIQPNASEIRFLRGRVKFIGTNTFGEKVSKKAGMHDSMVIIFNGVKMEGKDNE